MIHANAVSSGADFDWSYAGDPSEELLEEFNRLSEVNIEDLLK